MIQSAFDTGLCRLSRLILGARYLHTLRQPSLGGNGRGGLIDRLSELAPFSVEFAPGWSARITAQICAKGIARVNIWDSGKGWISTPAFGRMAGIGEILEVTRCYLSLTRFTDIAVRAPGRLEEVAILPGNHVQYMIGD
jgi:hypothetical protein